MFVFIFKFEFLITENRKKQNILNRVEHLKRM